MKAKRIISAITAFSVMSSFAVVSQAEEKKEYKLAETAVVSTPSEWGSNVFGEWSFWSVPEFYNRSAVVATLPDENERIYLDLSDVGEYGDAAKISPAGDYTHIGVLNLKTFDVLYGHGIVMRQTEWRVSEPVIHWVTERT